MRPGTAPSGLLRKESNLTDQPQPIAKGDMAGSVHVKRGARAQVRPGSVADFSKSPYGKPYKEGLSTPTLPPAIQPRQLSSAGGLRPAILERAKAYSSMEFSRTAPESLSSIRGSQSPSEERSETDSNGLPNRSSSLSNMGMMNGSEATALVPGKWTVSTSCLQL